MERQTPRLESWRLLPGLWVRPSSIPLTPTDLVFTFRLVGGLASENVRWAESVKNFKSQGVTLCGDVLLISAFVSYVGYFTKKYRNELMEKFWVPYINQLKVRGSVAFITQEIWGGPRGGVGETQPNVTVMDALAATSLANADAIPGGFLSAPSGPCEWWSSRPRGSSVV